MFAFILIGGICSGKTSLAKEITSQSNFELVSKDMCIYESDMLCRKGICKTWETIRENRIKQLIGKNIVFDETLRIGKLDEIKKHGYTIIGIRMSRDKDLRATRLVERNNVRKACMDELSAISQINLDSLSQNERRDLWRSQSFIDNLPTTTQAHFDEILKKIYLLGSHVLKDEEPNPACFPDIDYIINASDLTTEDFQNPHAVIDKSMSYQDYLKSWAKKVRYCIWDVGGVFYKFTLTPLYDWGLCHTDNKAVFNERIHKFSFNDYMSGKISFTRFCQSFCEFFAIPYHDEYDGKIEECLHRGIGELFPETGNSIRQLKTNGIINCVLSNALPALASDGNHPDLIEPDNRFYSFELKALKPENKIYTLMRDRLGATFEEMVFIDDKPRNVHAAIDLGMYSICFDRATINKELGKIHLI